MSSLPPRRTLVLLVLILVMTAIFIADTVTDYAVAAACFYAAVILAASRVLPRRGLLVLAASCIVLTALSFFLTRFGAFDVGVVNSAIGMLVIGITTYLALKMKAAKLAVQEAQARLLRVARASTVGELTTSIAHEVNQPLAPIATSAEASQRWLAQDPPNVEKARQANARILADAHRASDVIARIRGLTRGAAPERRAFSPDEAVDEMLALSRSELDQHGIVVARVSGADLPPVHADRVQVQQVIGNLILNAVDAMDGVPAATRRLSLVTAREGLDRVSLSVRDRGVGLPADLPERVFDAFWTTKARGLGLGLSLSRSIIEANEGHIRAERPSGGGACFIFDLPACTEHDHAHTPAPAVEPSPIVYVVDDDHSVRAALEDLLASMGLQVQAFESTQAFLAHPLADAPACLVLDVRMPGQSGLDFSRQMASLGLFLPVVFITGHGDIAMGVSAMKSGAIEFLTKPFRDQELLDAIHQGIERDRQRRRDDGVLDKLRQRWDSLTPGERDVVGGVVRGRLNKQIAGDLGVSEITVKVRRAHAMRKMQARTLVDLVRMYDRLGLEHG
ncbi:MAG: Response regulator protein TodT [Stenotrophomonas maltophilia]|uniref:histidine kinase n=1 Tax=Stenotrophomonas maltophilia TaxID=40324 RepID=A0A7V8FJ73_STEMA|nr:MAG: Response regulator protein TodT [Stenotrophomonas maltophilia]